MPTTHFALNLAPSRQLRTATQQRTQHNINYRMSIGNICDDFDVTRLCFEQKCRADRGVGMAGR
jgi:hypothetical protein